MSLPTKHEPFSPGPNIHAPLVSRSRRRRWLLGIGIASFVAVSIAFLAMKAFEKIRDAMDRGH